MASKVAVKVSALAVPLNAATDWFSVMYRLFVLSTMINVAFGGTEIWNAGYVITVAEPNVALLPTAIVATAADDVVFAAVIDVIRFTVFTAGFKPVSVVVPSNVHEVVAVAADDGIT
jgi:hypothetical protein